MLVSGGTVFGSVRSEVMARGRLNIIERAYDLARSGECLSLGDLKARLAEEGYSHVREHLYGAALSSELRKLVGEARDAAPEAGEDAHA